MAESNFVDYVKINCRSGKGGKGSMHLRHVKYQLASCCRWQPNWRKSRQVVTCSIRSVAISNCGLTLFAEHQSAKVSESP
mgnify:CR=1 FL=1